MEKKKANLGEVVTGAGKAAADLFGKAKRTIVSAVDQNNDGELNMKDVAIVAETIGTAAKKAADTIKDSANSRAIEQELKTLCPIFEEDLVSVDFLMPKLVRVTEKDKKHKESALCKGSIGHMSVSKEMSIINIYRDKADIFGLTFFPDMDREIYYVDPVYRNRYIALDGYFGHLKEARVNELQKIAHDLGAVYCKVTYKEQQIVQTTKNGKGNLNAASSAASEVNYESTSNAFSSVEIEAEMTCPGHAPIKPQPVYLQREPSIQSLIALRMDTESPITHRKYSLKLSDSSGIRESDAVKIDAVLKSIKCSAHASVTTEAQKEANRFLEYEIDF